MLAQTFIVQNTTIRPNTHGNPIGNKITFTPSLIPVSDITIDIFPTIGVTGTRVLPNISSNIPTGDNAPTKMYPSFPISIPATSNEIVLCYDVVIPIPDVGTLDLDMATFTYTISYSYKPCQSASTLQFSQSDTFNIGVALPLHMYFLPRDVSLPTSSTCATSNLQQYIIYCKNSGGYDFTATLSFYPNGLNQNDFPPGFVPIASGDWIEDRSHGRVYRTFILSKNMSSFNTYFLCTNVDVSAPNNYVPTTSLVATYPQNQTSRTITFSGTLSVIQDTTPINVCTSGQPAVQNAPHVFQKGEVHAKNQLYSRKMIIL